MNKHLAPILLLVLALSGCEQIIPADDLPYVNQLVIHGILTAGRPIVGISITHTLPLNTEFSSDAADVPDAIATITVDGKTIPLTYQGYSMYNANTSDTVIAGKTYSIDVRWQGLHASATTTVPLPANVYGLGFSKVGWDTTLDKRASYPDTMIQYGATLRVNIIPRNGEAYQLNVDSIVADTGDLWSYSFYGQYYPYTVKDTVNGLIQFTDPIYFDYVDRMPWFYFEVSAIDEAYAKLLKSYSSGREHGPFSSFGKNPEYNVTGDGVGMFIGLSTQHYKLRPN